MLLAALTLAYLVVLALIVRGWYITAMVLATVAAATLGPALVITSHL